MKQGTLFLKAESKACCINALFMELHLKDIYRKKLVPSEKLNLRYQIQMTRVREGTPGIRETIPS